VNTVEQLLQNTLSKLAIRHIPEGQHRSLHVNVREYWKKLMLELIETESIKPRLSILTKCAIHWEALLAQKISIQN
jgi:hypothetical protein